VALAVTSDQYLGQTVEGIDVSSHQGAIDWAAVQAHGIRFAFVRIGDGRSIDSRFAENFAACKRLKIPVGTYRYLRARHDQGPIAAQDANAIAGLGGFAPTDLGPAVDIEGGSFSQIPGLGEVSSRIGVASIPGLNATHVRYVADAAERYISAVASQSGKRGIVYGGSSLMAMASVDANALAPLGKYPLWRPDYGPNYSLQPQMIPVRIPPPWSRYTFHQYGNRGDGAPVPGIPTADVDHIRFRGGDVAFLLWRLMASRTILIGGLIAGGTILLAIGATWIAKG